MLTSAGRISLTEFCDAAERISARASEHVALLRIGRVRAFRVRDVARRETRVNGAWRGAPSDENQRAIERA